MHNNKYSVLMAVVYSDVFSFPLSLTEVWRYAGGAEKIAKADCREALTELFPQVKEKNGYYVLTGREELVAKREQGTSHARRKMQRALSAAKMLSHIPTVSGIGVSGGVAAGSAKERDDIDFFIITRKNTLFVTRLCILFLLQLTGKRRKRHDVSENNKICVNMLLDESALGFPPERQDIFTAREITQLIPLFERDEAYRRFIAANRWVSSLLPNARQRKSHASKKTSTLFESILVRIFSLRIGEIMARRWQLRQIHKHTTTETVTDHLLAFHPNDYREKTVKAFNRRMKRYKPKVEKRVSFRSSPYIDKEKNIFYTA
jgi:hypothetical protein